MIRTVSSQTMTQIDASSQRDGAIPALLLMEQAGSRAWQCLARNIADKGRCIVFIAGGGNNGGDALVMARHAFQEGFTNISCIVFGSHVSASCAAQRLICKNLGIPMFDVSDGCLDSIQPELARASLIIDGIAGTGLRGPLSGVALQLVNLINEIAGNAIPVIALDVPSGASDEVPVASAIIQATATISMGLVKGCCYHPVVRSHCGELLTVDPGFPTQIVENAPTLFQVASYDDCILPSISNTEYKNTRGHVAIFGGSASFTGAPRLSCRSAFHCRVGLVTLFADEETYPILATENPSVIVKVRDPQLKSSDLSSYSALLAGPGWGPGREALLRILLDSRIPLVFDADGIKAYASLVHNDPLALKAHGPLLLTPHPGELRILVTAVLGEAAAQVIGRHDTPSQYQALLCELARRCDATILAKGHVNWIVSPQGEVVVVDGMMSELGVAGSGDVLAGICSALLCDGSIPLEAAKRGVLVHLKAGQLCKASFGWFSSEELVDKVGLAVNSFVKSTSLEVHP